MAQTSETQPQTQAQTPAAAQTPRARGADPLRWIATRPLDLRLLAVVGVLAVVLRVVSLGGGMLDYDEGVYWQSLRAMAAGHPLFAQVFSSQPPAFLDLVYPFYALFGQSIAAARLGIVVYSLVGLAAIYVIGRAVAGRWAGLAAVALLAFDPAYLAESHTLQAEAPSVALALVCVALAVSAARAQVPARRRVLAVLAGAALALGILIKLWDVVAVVPAVLYLAAPLFASLRGPDGRLRRPERAALMPALRTTAENLALFALGALGAGILILAPYLSHWSDLWNQVVAFHIAAGHTSGHGLLYNLSLLLSNGLAYPLALAALVGFLLGIGARDWRIAPPLLWLGASALLLLDQQPLFDHHRVLLLPPLALLAALALPLAARQAPVALRRGASVPIAPLAATLLLVVTLLTLGLGVASMRTDAAPPNGDQAQAAVALERLTVPGDVVASDDQYAAALAGRDVPPELVDTSQVRIASGYLTAAQLEAILTRDDVRAILFSSGRFALIPGFTAWVQAHYTEVVDLGGGRGLYIKSPPQPVTRV
ncbi:MAG TPA: glycosyltransferase family 39 protein [Ktedonobacterales bacterium]